MTKPKSHVFQSKLERIADDMEYFALSVPERITRALGTKAAVPVLARLNGSTPFINSLYPVGGGRHYLRIKAVVRKETKNQEGDRVRVEFTVRDREKEVSLPKDLASALKADGVLETFKAMPPGQKSFILRKIEEAAQPKTREKRIAAAVEEAHARREKQADRSKR